ncbi:MAG: hypothetical protein U1U88_000821 [Lawsonella clevelandensis]
MVPRECGRPKTVYAYRDEAEDALSVFQSAAKEAFFRLVNLRSLASGSERDTPS